MATENSPNRRTGAVTRQFESARCFRVPKAGDSAGLPEKKPEKSCCLVGPHTHACSTSYEPGDVTNAIQRSLFIVQACQAHQDCPNLQILQITLIYNSEVFSQIVRTKIQLHNGGINEKSSKMPALPALPHAVRTRFLPPKVRCHYNFIPVFDIMISALHDQQSHDEIQSSIVSTAATSSFLRSTVTQRASYSPRRDFSQSHARQSTSEFLPNQYIPTQSTSPLFNVIPG